MFYVIVSFFLFASFLLYKNNQYVLFITLQFSQSSAGIFKNLFLLNMNSIFAMVPTAQNHSAS